jgi:spore coat polysaccharide biosynthesis predicted glycosyltransferase SpsG
MRIAIRADASINQGTGHVMRCITLAKSLKAKGVEVTILSSIEGIPWLTKYVQASGIQLEDTQHGSLDSSWPKWLSFDLVIVDSYEINAREISMLNEQIPVLALIDGDNRGISASIYLDQNLGAEMQSNDAFYKKRDILFGAKFALVRSEVIDAKIPFLRNQNDLDFGKILVFLGGTDPGNGILKIGKLLRDIEFSKITLIAKSRQHDQIRKLLEGKVCEIIEFTNDLPQLIRQADAVVSAGGTSAWDIATIGTPAAYVCVAENQRNSIQTIEKLGLGIYLGDLDDIESNEKMFTNKVDRLLSDSKLRNTFFKNCRVTFDGYGSERVAEYIFNWVKPSTVLPN